MKAQDWLNSEQSDKLAHARVLVLGHGGIAGYCVESLAASGIGTIVTADLGACPNDFSCDVTVVNLENFDIASVEPLIKASSLVIDILNDWQMKLLVSDLCMSSYRPLLHGACASMRSQLFLMQPGRSCCLRCLLAALGIEDTIMEAGAESAFPAFNGLIGNALALAAIKQLSGLGASQSNELIKLDCLSGELEVLRGFDPVADCPDCGTIRRAGNR